MAAPWGAIIQAIDHAAQRITNGAGSGIEVAKSQNGGAVGSGAGGSANSGSTTDTSLFGKAVQTATSNIKDKVASLNNNPKVGEVEVVETEVANSQNGSSATTPKIEEVKVEGTENGTGETEGVI